MMDPSLKENFSKDKGDMLASSMWAFEKGNNSKVGDRFIPYRLGNNAYENRFLNDD